jgi:outer membrane protein OmpA-like peptidoglycan-associated protein
VEDVLFEPESSELSREARRHLWTVIWVMRRDPDLRVVVRGHADSTGNPARNIELARARAEVSARFLTEEGGVETSRVSIDSAGSREPAEPGTTSRALARSRRVELVWR